MPSAKDKCFAKAVDNLKNDGKKLQNLDIKSQKRWVQDTEKVWSQTSEAWYKVVGAVSRFNKFLRGLAGAPAPGSTIGTRIPDMTVTPDGGKPIVIDNKFKGDDWQPGQREAYNEINKQQNGDPKAEDLQLNSDVCKCGEPGSLDPVPVPVQAPSMNPMLSPFSPYAMPGTAGAGAGAAAGEGAGAAVGGGLLGEPIPAF